MGRGAWWAQLLQSCPEGCKESDMTEATEHTCTRALLSIVIGRDVLKLDILLIVF